MAKGGSPVPIGHVASALAVLDFGCEVQEDT